MKIGGGSKPAKTTALTQKRSTACQAMVKWRVAGWRIGSWAGVSRSGVFNRDGGLWRARPCGEGWKAECGREEKVDMVWKSYVYLIHLWYEKLHVWKKCDRVPLWCLYVLEEYEEKMKEKPQSLYGLFSEISGESQLKERKSWNENVLEASLMASLNEEWLSEVSTGRRETIFWNMWEMYCCTLEMESEITWLRRNVARRKYSI
jgi:hypothetical protein